MMKKNHKQRLEDSLSEAINPKPKTDRLNNVHSLLDTYPPAPNVLPANDLDSQINKIGYPNEETLDSNIAKDTVWIAKEEPILAINIDKEKSLDSQNSKKTGK